MPLTEAQASLSGVPPESFTSWILFSPMFIYEEQVPHFLGTSAFD